MQFQVPQFIEIEDKIFGPLTLKQFLYVAGGLGASVALYVYLPIKFVAVIIALPLIIFSVCLAFYKVNGKPFIDVVENAFYFYFGEKLYIWKKAEKKPTGKIIDDIKMAKSLVTVPKMSESKLKDLTWSLDIKESLNPVTRGEER
jgi:hypothetical protein